MDSKMVNDHMEEVQSSAWPENINEEEKRFNLENPGEDADMFQGVKLNVNPTAGDFHHLVDLTNYSEKGSSHLSNLVKSWEYKQTNVVRLLREELDTLSKQQKKVELEKSEMIKEHRSVEHQYGGDERPFSMLDKVPVPDIQKEVHQRRNDVVIHDQRPEVEGEYDTVNFWKQRAIHLEKLLEESMKREQIALEKLQESIQNLERQSSPVEELSQVLRRADNFFHFILQNAPVVMGHQDNKLRYRFCYNQFPSLGEEDIVGKTDVEIFSGGGVKELQDFKKEVLEREIPGKIEVTFETELFGSKTFLIYVEPVFSKAGETIGMNYIGMDVTDQKAVQEKQVLTTISHEIRSPLAGLVSMAEKLSKTKLDKEQTKILSAILSSGDLVQQIINDILDLPKAESGLELSPLNGVMSSEAMNCGPLEVDVLQTDEASLQKLLKLEECVTDDDPLERGR